MTTSGATLAVVLQRHINCASVTPTQDVLIGGDAWSRGVDVGMYGDFYKCPLKVCAYRN